MEKSTIRIALQMLTEGATARVSDTLRAEAIEKHEVSSNWAESKNVQGLGIGSRETEGKRLSDIALKVYVEKKLPKEKLGDELVPKEIAFTEMGAAIPTDVEEIGKLQPELDTMRHRPAYPGCGLAHRNDGVGTFGCLVVKADEPGKLQILSNSHVLAMSGNAALGDSILQPGPTDGGAWQDDEIAKLTDFVPFQYGGAFTNLVDAAIAEVLVPADVTDEIGTIMVVPKELGVARIGTRVKKVGRTTGLTYGEVTDTDFRASLQYKRSNGQKAWVGFRDQVVCTRYTSPGDSGSAVLHQDSNKLLGLHFAGSESISVFNKIHHVMESLNLILPDL